MAEESNPAPVDDSVSRKFGADLVAENPAEAVRMLNAWIAELTTQARSLSLQHRISEAVDGKAGERPKKLMADLEKVRLSIAEARAIIADLG